ncbi:hypothetical protein GCM10020220_091440 [Nonomuraea rubra]
MNSTPPQRPVDQLVVLNRGRPEMSADQVLVRPCVDLLRAWALEPAAERGEDAAQYAGDRVLPGASRRPTNTKCRIHAAGVGKPAHPGRILDTWSGARSRAPAA